MTKKSILSIVWGFNDSKLKKRIIFEKPVRIVYSNDKKLVFVVYTNMTTTPPVFDYAVLPNGHSVALGTNDPKRKALSVVIEDGFYNVKTKEVFRKGSLNAEILKNYQGRDIVYLNDIAMPDIKPTNVVEIEGRNGKQLHSFNYKK